MGTVIRLGLLGRWPLADSRKATKREGARLEGNPDFRVREKAPMGVRFIAMVTLVFTGNRA